MDRNWGQMYSQGTSQGVLPKLAKPPRPKWNRPRKKKTPYTWKKTDTVWSVAKQFDTTPEELLGLNKAVQEFRPGVSIYAPAKNTNRFNQAQAGKAKDRRDKRWSEPGGGGIRKDWFGEIKTPQGEVLFSSLPYQSYRLNWFAEQGILPLTVNTWVADQLGYTDLLKEYGYKLNSNLDRWERPAVYPWEGNKPKGSGGGGYGGGYGGGGGGRGGGGGYTQPAQPSGMGFGGAYSPQGGGYSRPVQYAPRGGTGATGRQWGGIGPITWRI